MCLKLICIKLRSDNHFYIKVESGSIHIYKSFDNNNYDYDDGDPIFIFKLTDSNENVYYKSVRFNKTDDNEKFVGEITGLGKGSYTIEELGALRFKNDSCSWGYSQDSMDVNRNNTIIIDKGNRNAFAMFTNSVKSAKFDSDNDICINKFTKDSSGKLSLGKDLLNE